MPEPKLPMAVTMGDPAGIGPEIILRMYQRRPDQACWLVLGDPGCMVRAAGLLDADVTLHPITTPEAVKPGCLNLLPTSHLAALPPLGQVSAEAGLSAYHAIATAIELARTGVLRTS